MFVAARAGSRRYLPAVEGTIIGLTFGLIDIHSREGDWFNSKALLLTDPFFGLSTFYSDRVRRRAFDSLRVGMSQRDVENIVGKPLRRLPWNQEAGAHNEELWCYSNRTDETFNFWRRWVFFTDGKVVSIANDFWVD